MNKEVKSLNISSTSLAGINVGEKIWTFSVLDYSAAYKGVDPGLKSQPQEAKMVCLDDWTFRNRLQEKRMFIKLDTQGYEKDCIEGARNILNNGQMIQCESYRLSSCTKAHGCLEMLSIGFKTMVPRCINVNQFL